MWLSGAQTARIPKNSRAGKQGGRLPVLLGENRRELGEIEAFWNERSRFPERARLPTAPSTAASYPMQLRARNSVSLEGSTYAKSPPTLYGNSSACTHGTGRTRAECVLRSYVCDVRVCGDA